jgi:hypothetical protein
MLLGRGSFATMDKGIYAEAHEVLLPLQGESDECRWSCCESAWNYCERFGRKKHVMTMYKSCDISAGTMFQAVRPAIAAFRIGEWNLATYGRRSA